MSWFNSIELLGKLIPIAQVLIVILTVFTIWASVQKGDLEKQEKLKLSQQVEQSISAANNLESQLKESKEELAKVKQMTSPRKLTAEQKNQLIKMLSFPGDFQVTTACRIMDSEGCNYAQELADVFSKAKWKVGQTNKTFLDDTKGDLVITILEDNQIKTVRRLIEILNKCGIDARQEKIRKNSISGIQKDTIYLIVGSKKTKRDS